MSEMGMAMMGSGSATGQDRALMAAQSAIGSPLLEDVNLSGACGILVNVTAGMNLSMKEFEEIGTTIADLASEDASVVMGTVIDPDMNDEIRVTVVATGLGQRVRKREEKPMQIVRTGTDNQPIPAAPDDDDTDERGAGGRGSGGRESRPRDAEQQEFEYLDIPAFLRNQAD
jgi:cell division protein FtsZ